MAQGQGRHMWPGGEVGGLNLELCGRQILENTTVRYPGTYMLNNGHLHLLKCNTAKIGNKTASLAISWLIFLSS